MSYGQFEAQVAVEEEIRAEEEGREADELGGQGVQALIPRLCCLLPPIPSDLPQVWMSYGQFEAQVAVEEEIKAEEEGREADELVLAEQCKDRVTRARAHEEEGKEADELVLAEQCKDRVTRAREVYERAFEHMRTNAADQKEERVMLLEAWREMERAAGVNGDPGLVEKKMPRRVKRKRPITTEDGTPAGCVHTHYVQIRYVQAPIRVVFFSLCPT
ncbi:unnamed protein product [Closterium sp. Naga37s-1]|nr:unnamed protein product [Closterium sp. Naga37s-1]